MSALTRALTKCGRIGLSGICSFSVRSEKPIVLADLLSWPTCALPPQRGASRSDAASCQATGAARASSGAPPGAALSARRPPLQMQLEPGVPPAEAVVLDEMLVARLDREAQVTLAIEPAPLLPPGRSGPVCPTPGRAG